ncbi:Zn-dependent oligopeptidase, partial [Myxococcota bacterium]|nr:Zn-dependent oligopeptidase [Myxococcota bacterium]
MRKLLIPVLMLAGACTPSNPTDKAAAEGAEVDKDKTTEVAKKEEALVLSEAALKYQAECKANLDTAQKIFAELEADKGEKTVATVLEKANKLWIEIDRGYNTAGLLANVHPDEGLRNTADKCEQDFAKLNTNIGLSRPLFDAISAVDISKENKVTKRYVDHVLRDFRRAGVDKDPATREKIRTINEELVKIGQNFGKNIRSDVRQIELSSVDDLKGLPADYIEAHKPNKEGKIILTTDYTDYVPFANYAESDAKRFEFYKIFRNRANPKNKEVLESLINKRHELAQLLGYKTWAHYITEDKMIKTDKAAADFIDKIATVSAKRADKDYAELLKQLQKEQPAAKKVGDWQKSYIEEQLKRDKYAFDSQSVRKYFPYDNVKNGVLTTVSKLFGVEFKKVEREVWHPSVESYEISDGGKVIGKFFLDMHPRDNKYKHAAAFPIASGVEGVQVPEASLVCNFPGGDDPMELMEHDQVVTFFHEFGHLIHHLFGGQHRWVGVSGFNTEWDFVEAPSQMLEEWAWTAESLQSFAKTTDGKVLPKEDIAKMNKARNFGKGLWVKHQMFYASVSLGYY